MKIDNVTIRRHESYSEYPNQMVGTVQLSGEHGKMEVKMSPAVIANIFSIIRADVQRVANYNASQAAQAVDDAGAEQLLIEQEEGVTIPTSIANLE